VKLSVDRRDNLSILVVRMAEADVVAKTSRPAGFPAPIEGDTPRAWSPDPRSIWRSSPLSLRSGVRQAVWRYKGKTIVVTYAKNGGKISIGWVR
jgi:hypothetical protein